MATKAYFLINVAKEFCQCQNDYQKAIEELKAIPEVKSVEPVFGTCDLIVQVEAPIRAVFVADKIVPKEWVKRLVVLKVQPFQFDGLYRTSTRELLKDRIAFRKENKTPLAGRI